jgi:dTDP-4-amino-4,6-dideoxygalactose transaminase
MKKNQSRIPYLNLKKQYEDIKEEINSAIFSVIEKCAYAGGEFVEEFENEFAKFCNCKYAVGVGSGTEAIWLSLIALGVGQCDEVITVPNTFFATIEAINHSGAKTVFVDIEEETYNIDINKLESAITEKTKAIIPVHLYGQMTNMEAVMAIAKRNNLFVIEDACQAHGSEFNGKMPGYYGDCACFSFYPGKNLGAYGDAGAVVTNDYELAKMISVLREHGQTHKYLHNHYGWNCRMDGLQGAILNVKLRHLNKWIDMRRENAMTYNKLLKHNKFIKIPFEDQHMKHVYHIYAIRTKPRDELQKALSWQGIETGIHYPVPIHLQKAYRQNNQDVHELPVSEKCANELLSLPMYPELEYQQIEFICHEINNMPKY